MDKIAFVTCPRCSGEYYIERSDYVGKPDAPCHCPFCGMQFTAGEGNPRPPLTVSERHG
jgi:uncharacterized Zn-finger protein